ncbi:glycosyltransferase family 10 domain-containing protein [Pigmentibacter ruber]
MNRKQSEFRLLLSGVILGNMKKASMIIEGYKNNDIFDINNESISRDNCNYFHYRLREKFLSEGIDLSTTDINDVNNSIIHFYIDMPKVLPKIEDVKKSFLYLSEYKVVKPENYNFSFHKYFNKIFTWNDDLVDNKKYFKISPCYAIDRYDLNNSHSFKDKKLCTMISGHKYSYRENELYSERIKVIKWFEKNYPDHFDLFGANWDRFVNKKETLLDRVIVKSLNSLNLKPNFKLYKGSIKNKSEILKKYKFSFCYENAKNINGYITEKIFDSFFASCVPIYWGAANIKSYIPENCYILKENFSSYYDLYKYIESISEKEYILYVENIHKFLNSDKFNQFSCDYICKVIYENIINAIDD